MRNQRHKLERIDIDELFSSPVNRGMLSFLERPPEEAQVRLREKQKVNAIDAGRLAPGGELPPGANSQDSVTLSGESNIQRQDQAMQSNQSSLDRTSGTVSVQCELPPGGELPSGGELPPVSELTSGDNQPAAGQVLVGCPTLLDLQTTPNADPSSLLRSARHGITPPPAWSYPGGELPGGIRFEQPVFSAETLSGPGGGLAPGPLTHEQTNTEASPGVSHPVGSFYGVIQDDNVHTRPQEPQTFWNSKQKNSRGNTHPGAQPNLYLSRRTSTRIAVSDRVTENPAQPEAIDGSVVGRRQKVRRAIVAQDGHSSGEQLLYQALWNAASAETPETRLLSIGYSGMSALCKLEKSNCKKNVQGLIQKLAVEITEPHQSVSSTGTTYRVFSYKEILRRRETAGMVWVVRTSGVRFVDPGGNLRPGSVGEIRGGAGGESPPPPVGSAALGREGILPRGPMGKTPTQLETQRKNQESLLPSASENIGQLCTFARSQIAEFDDDACRLLWHKCKEVAPDCTIAEVIYCFDLKARQLFNERVRNVGNPVGLMIWSVPKMFEGPEALYLQRRRAKADEAAKAAEAVAQFERNRADWQALLENPSTSDEDRKFYRRLLGYSVS